jgi:hypothetical protein
MLYSNGRLFVRSDLLFLDFWDCDWGVHTTLFIFGVPVPAPFGEIWGFSSVFRAMRGGGGGEGGRVRRVRVRVRGDVWCINNISEISRLHVSPKCYLKCMCMIYDSEGGQKRRSFRFAGTVRH